MFLEHIKENKSYSKLILLIAALVLAMFVLPTHAQAASAVKTKKITMRVGQSRQLKLKGVTDTLKWKSLNKKKVKVTSTGLITAKKKGTATIRVKYEGVTYKFIVKVYKKKKNQSTAVKTVTMKLKKTATAVAESGSTSDSETEKFTAAKYAGLKTTATGSFAQNKIVMIGDSRFVGMNAAVSNSSKWYCKVGMGLSWLQSTIAPKLEKLIARGFFENKAVVFNLGVNDLGNVGNYISYLNDLGEDLRDAGASVYFMTVNPIDDESANDHGYTVRNDSVITFNKKMVSGLSGFGIIDTYDELVYQGFSTADGVHYTTSTYKTIYSYMYDCIGA